MPLDVLTNFDKTTYYEEAARTLVLASTDRKLTETEIQDRVATLLGDRLVRMENDLLGRWWGPTDILLSNTERDNVGNKRFMIEALSRVVNDIGSRVERSRRSYANQMHVLNRRVLGIGGDLFGVYQAQIQYRLTSATGWAFGLSDLSAIDPSYTHMQDPRSERKFLPWERVGRDHWGLALMPAVNEERVQIREVDVDYSLTGMFGVDGRMELSDPMLAIEPGKTFTARYFVPLPPADFPQIALNPTMNLTFKFSAPAVVNEIKLRSHANHLVNPIIEYRSGTGDWEQLQVRIYDPIGGAYQRFITDNVVTDAIRMTFFNFDNSQYTEVQKGDLLNSRLNEPLREAGWKALLPEEDESFVGKLFEWHLSDVEFSSITFAQRGACVTDPLQIDGKIKRLTSSGVASLSDSGDEGDEEDVGSFAGVECYAIVHLKNKEGQVVADEMVPVPKDINGQETEFCVFRGEVSMLRFFPQINADETMLEPNGTAPNHDGVLPQVLSLSSGLLAIGTDYQVTVDGGQTWLSAWPSADFYGKVSHAGMAGIRMLSRDPDDVYAVMYTLARRQWLTPSKNWQWRGTRVVATRRLRRQHVNGTTRGAIILRNPQDQGAVSIASFLHGARYVG